VKGQNGGESFVHMPSLPSTANVPHVEVTCADHLSAQVALLKSVSVTLGLQVIVLVMLLFLQAKGTV
jgi:hypothetical protein